DRAREDVSLDTWTTAHTAIVLHCNLVCATAHHDSVDVVPVVFHDRFDFFGPEQPVDGVVFASEEVVETVSATKPHFAHWNLSCIRGNCRGGPPWPPLCRIPRRGGHGGPP